MVFLRLLSAFIILSFLGIGCSPQLKSGSATVTLKMPEQLQQQKAGGIHALASNACFAVNIMADDIPGTANSECDQSFGSFGGLVAAGGTIATKYSLP